jgi:hypothetical protein
VYTKLKIEPERKLEKILTPETAIEVVWPDAVGYNIKAEFKEKTPAKESQNIALPSPKPLESP